MQPPTPFSFTRYTSANKAKTNGNMPSQTRRNTTAGRQAVTTFCLPFSLLLVLAVSACNKQPDTEAANTSTPPVVASAAATTATNEAEAATQADIQAETANAATHALPELQLLPESNIAFTAEQIGVPLEGRFKAFTASVRLDPLHTDVDTLAAASIHLTVDTHSITVGVPDTDKELTGDAWFGRTGEKQAVFVSSVVASPSENTFEVTGMLTINGKSRALTTLATAEPLDGGKWLVTGSFPLQRLAFDVGTSPWDDTSVVADKVDVRYSLQFMQPQPEPSQQPEVPAEATTEATAKTAVTKAK